MNRLQAKLAAVPLGGASTRPLAGNHALEGYVVKWQLFNREIAHSG